MSKDIYKIVTDSIIEALEGVSVDRFKAPFARLASQQLPINPMTGHDYHGINTLMLWFSQMNAGFFSNEWGTYKQWKDRGVQVKNGEKSTMIIFYKPVEKKESGGDDPEFYHMLKSYNVFNADQVEGYDPDIMAENDIFGSVEKLEQIDSYIAANDVMLVEGTKSACFIPSKDEIHMPRKDVFFEEEGQSVTENYYAVLLHELTHWTGGKSRLERPQTSRSEDIRAYAYEELIAELGSAFLCAQFDIKQYGRDDHAAYIKSWLQALRSDKKFIFKAAADAQKAVDFLNSGAKGDAPKILIN